MLNFIKDYEIPEDGITDQFKVNSYASFAMELLNLCKDDKKLLMIYEINEWEGEKEYTETIDVKDEDGNISEAKKTVKKNVLSYTAILTSNVQTIVNGKRKVKKPVRKLPNPALEPEHPKPTKKDIPVKPSKPSTPEPEPKEPKKPKDNDGKPVKNK